MESGEPLKNIKAVVKYLDTNGWKVSKSTVYRHRDEGKIRPGTDGCFPLKSAEKYARDWLNAKDGSGGTSKKVSPVQNDKQSAEARKVSAQAEHWEIKTKILKSEYVERTAFERALAQRAAVFKSDIENFIRSNASEMVHVVGGDALKIPDFIDYWLEKSETWLGRYSADKERELPISIDVGILESIEN